MFLDLGKYIFKNCRLCVTYNSNAMVMGSWGHHAAHPWTAPLYNVKLPGPKRLDQTFTSDWYIMKVCLVNFQHVTITGRAANVAKGDGIC